MNTVPRLSVGVWLLLATTAVAFAADRPGFSTHRYDEDWRAFCAVTPAHARNERLKCLSVTDATLLTLGGEWRERVEAVDAAELGVGTRSDAYILHRGLLHGDLRYGERLRVFAQFGSLHQNGRRGGPAPTDLDVADLQQGFVDLSTAAGGGYGLLRIGRQEMALGSSRLISVRESPNARRAFDGVRLRWLSSGDSVDAFLLQPVSVRRGVFDNRRQRGERLWGLQWTRAGERPGTDLEIYYLGLRREQVRYIGGSAKEQRHSLGARLSGGRAGFDWNLELVTQLGEWGSQKIRAWTFASDAGYSFDAMRGRPRLSLKANVASGDGNPADGRLRTFNALYPNPTYFSEASLIAPANIVDLQPGLSAEISRQIKLAAGWDWLWKHRQADAIYTPPGSPLAGSDGGSNKIGNQVHLTLLYAPSRSWQLRTAWVRFNAAGAVRQAGGADVDYWAASAAFRF